MRCPSCSQDNLADARFCQNCGQPLESSCPTCGTSNTADARFCRRCGTALGAAADRLSVLRQAAPQTLQDKMRAASASIEGERKPVTILFTDIVGSTSLAERLDPEEWKEIVSGAHQRISDAVYRYEGTIAQLLGDGVLAFFGAPITHEDDPIRAVRAALDIQEAIRAYAQELRGYVDDFQMRIGINTGMVVIGSVGSDMHVEYLAIGDAVNLAARLQSAARPGQVLISEGTERLVKAAFELEPLGEISVKGKAEPVRVFEAVKSKAAPGSGRGLHELGSPFVGREPELGALTAGLDDLAAGHGQIIAILGEAGIGKSRLVEEARRQAHELRWLEGRALSYGETLSFWMITQLINQDLGLSEGDPEPRIKAALRRRVSVLFGDEAASVMPYLAHLMGVKLDDESAQRVRQLDGETLKRQALWAIGEYFSAVAREQPAVLVFEDLHWADPSTLEALEKLLALTDRAPLLLLLLARVERDHGSWQIKVRAETDYAHRYTEIALRPLSAEDSRELVDRLLEVADLPERIRTLILEHSEGNPFYLEEIIRSLIEQGVILQEAGAWRATAEIEDVEIPETLQGVLLARIDRLQEDVRRTLQLASVIGRSFLYRLLEAIAAAERQVDEHLSLLQRADLVREKSRRPELEYIFKHSLTQEAAYSSLLLERRREFHRRVGEALEQLFADRAEEFYGLLAHHFDAAGENARATDYLIKAGDKSRLEDAHEEAIRFYRRAIELLEQSGDIRRAARTWLKLGLIQQTDFHFEQAHEANETAFALEREARLSQAQAQPLAQRSGPPHTLRLLAAASQLGTLDPRRLTFSPEAWIASHLFVGLAEFDAETNVVPHAARSWEVLDGGRRYVFHLRDDMRWTDGEPLTARDFELTWKHILTRGGMAVFPDWMDHVVGGREHAEGRNSDPDSVGVRALDVLTFEVRLTAPIAHFIYLVAQPYSFALPLRRIEKYGDDWWKPGTIVSNGAFQLAEFDGRHGLLRRNPDYFGEFSGNLDQYTWTLVEDREEVARAYLAGEVDYAPDLRLDQVPGQVGADEQVRLAILQTRGLILNPLQPPMDDVRVRRAIAHALDRRRLAEAHWGIRTSVLPGGLVPAGIAGHSPELGLHHDLERARRLLAEAGYPGGRDFPILKYTYAQGMTARALKEFERQLLEGLGIRIEAEAMLMSRPWWQFSDSHIQGGGWIADYPDPHNFLEESFFVRNLRIWGWRHARLEQLLEEAAHTTDRARRLAMYREADRILVDEEVVTWPYVYGTQGNFDLLKPWVKGMRFNTMGNYSLKDIVIEPH